MKDSRKHAKAERTRPHDMSAGAAEHNPRAGPEANGRHPAGGSAAEADEELLDHVPTPDEDGPHDVPDEKVIEKTLPSVPLSGSAGNGSGRVR